MGIGDIVSFGQFDWQVLDIKENSALLLTKNIIELRAFHNKSGAVTWAESEIRYYLNKDFYNSFSQKEKSQIIQVSLKNNDNPWFDTLGGADTVDRIFLLSIEEVVCKYFGDSSENLKIPNGKYKYWFTRKDENNEKRKAVHLNCGWWWLRSPGRKDVKAAYVHGDGNIGIQGNNAFKCNLSGVIHPVTGSLKGGMRPSMWIKL